MRTIKSWIFCSKEILKFVRAGWDVDLSFFRIQ